MIKILILYTSTLENSSINSYFRAQRVFGAEPNIPQDVYNRTGLVFESISTLIFHFGGCNVAVSIHFSFPV